MYFVIFLSDFLSADNEYTNISVQLIFEKILMSNNELKEKTHLDQCTKFSRVSRSTERIDQLAFNWFFYSTEWHASRRRQLGRDTLSVTLRFVCVWRLTSDWRYCVLGNSDGRLEIRISQPGRYRLVVMSGAVGPPLRHKWSRHWKKSPCITCKPEHDILLSYS